jgi:predicted phosphodiesterase
MIDMQEPIRILSDLHFGHPASVIEHPSQLLPLLRDVKTVIFNGDTVELRYMKGRQLGMHNARLMRDVCAEAGVRPIFINGNHDPILSELCHVDLVNGAVLATHGDLLFHDISPWSHESEIIAEAHTRELASLDADSFLDFEKRLKASKRAALSIQLRKSRLRRDNLSVLRTVLRECWPPWRPLQILHSWTVTPERAEALLRVFRPRARIILIGHTHFSGCWRRGPRTIINTGSFLPMSGRMAVDIVGEKLTVRRIVRDRGSYRAGKVVGEYAATQLSAAEGA